MRKMILPATVMTIKRSAVQRTELVPRLRGQRKLGRVLASIKIIVLFAASVTLKHSVPEDLPWRTSAGTSGMSSSAILAERRVTSLTDVRTSGVESFDPWLQELSPQPPLGMQPLRTQHARSLNKEALPSENIDLQCEDEYDKYWAFSDIFSGVVSIDFRENFCKNFENSCSLSDSSVKGKLKSNIDFWKNTIEASDDIISNMKLGKAYERGSR